MGEKPESSRYLRFDCVSAAYHYDIPILKDTWESERALPTDQTPESQSSLWPW